MIENTQSYAEFFQTLISQIESVRGKPTTDGGFYTQTKARAIQIFRMEIYLRDYRKKYGTVWMPLPGISAANHRILTKFHWTIPAIEALTIEQVFFALHDEVVNHPISEGAEAALKQYALRDMPAEGPFQDFLKNEWMPEIAELMPSDDPF